MLREEEVKTKRIYGQINPPSAEQYSKGLSTIESKVSDLQKRLLVEQYHAPYRTVTAPQLAKLAQVRGDWRTVNLRYGGLGRIFCEKTGYRPRRRESGSYSWWRVWSSGYNTSNGFAWEMLPQVAEALETIGWVSPNRAQIPEEVYLDNRLLEGATRRITVNAYERNTEARRKCIEYYGSSCAVCELDLEFVYGPVAQGFIHVHHLKPLAEVDRKYEVDPVVDLRPVCPNCHSIIHLGGRTRSIREVKGLLETASTRQERGFDQRIGAIDG